MALRYLLKIRNQKETCGPTRSSTPVSRRPGSWSSNVGKVWRPRGALPSQVLQAHPYHRGGLLKDPVAHRCHSPKVDVGEEEQQHQGGHNQPAVDELGGNRQHDRRPRSSGLMPRPGNPSSLGSFLPDYGGRRPLYR